MRRDNKFTYEEALSSVGSQPTWVLRDIAERLPEGERNRSLAMLAIKFRDRNADRAVVSH